MYAGCQRRNMKVVFHINGQRVTYAHSRLVHWVSPHAFIGLSYSRQTRSPAAESASRSNCDLTSMKQPPFTILRANVSAPTLRNWRWATATTIASALDRKSTRLNSSHH